MADAWRLKTFALFAGHPSFAAISKTRIRLGTYKPLRYHAHSRTMADQILDILVDQNTHEFVVIGRTRYRGNISAFRVSADKIDNLESLDGDTKTNLHQYNPSTDCCCLFGDPEKGEHGVLIATIDQERREGKLSLAIERAPV